MSTSTQPIEMGMLTKAGATRSAKFYQSIGWTILTQPTLSEDTRWVWTMLPPSEGVR
jgi:hypothetical protein